MCHATPCLCALWHGPWHLTFSSVAGGVCLCLINLFVDLQAHLNVMCIVAYQTWVEYIFCYRERERERDFCIIIEFTFYLVKLGKSKWNKIIHLSPSLSLYYIYICKLGGRVVLLNASHVRPFCKYSILEGSKGPLTLSIDFITALAGRMLFDGSGEVL